MIVALPWGSLLSGILEPDAQILTGLRGLLKSKGELLLFLSDIDRRQIEALTDRFGEHGYQTVEVREAAESDVATLSSGWARRLGIPGSRPAWIIRLRG